MLLGIQQIFIVGHLLSRCFCQETTKIPVFKNDTTVENLMIVYAEIDNSTKQTEIQQNQDNVQINNSMSPRTNATVNPEEHLVIANDTSQWTLHPDFKVILETESGFKNSSFRIDNAMINLEYLIPSDPGEEIQEIVDDRPTVDQKPEVTIKERQDNPNCYVQTCDQTISGRQIGYTRALDIVQGEEYLQAADTTIIRRRSNFRFSKEPHLILRFKRNPVEARAPVGPGVVSNGLLDLFGDITLSLTAWCIQVATATADGSLSTKIAANCVAMFNANLCTSTDNTNICIATNVVTAQDVSLDSSGSSFQSACVTYATTQTSTLCTSVTTSTSTSDSPNFLAFLLDLLGRALPASAPATAGIVTALTGFLAIFPAFPLVTEVVNPPGSPNPGTPGGLGGGNPADATPSQLNLVPDGLAPVAVFPPFATPRTFPAEAVIFLENPDVDLVLNRPSQRSKRSLLNRISNMFFRRQRKSLGRRRNYEYHKRRSLWDEIKSGAFEIVDREVRKADRARKLLNKNMMCLRTRLMALGNRRRTRMLIESSQREQELLRLRNQVRPRLFKTLKGHLVDFEQYVGDETNFVEEEDFVVNSLDDCIEGIEEPLYGFRANVTLISNEPCVLGQTCRATLDGQQLRNITSTLFHERQSGEEFSADAPAECRVQFDASVSGCQN